MNRIYFLLPRTYLPRLIKREQNGCSEDIEKKPLSEPVCLGEVEQALEVEKIQTPDIENAFATLKVVNNERYSREKGGIGGMDFILVETKGVMVDHIGTHEPFEDGNIGVCIEVSKVDRRDKSCFTEVP